MGGPAMTYPMANEPCSRTMAGHWAPGGASMVAHAIQATYQMQATIAHHTRAS